MNVLFYAVEERLWTMFHSPDISYCRVKREQWRLYSSYRLYSWNKRRIVKSGVWLYTPLLWNKWHLRCVCGYFFINRKYVEIFHILVLYFQWFCYLSFTIYNFQPRYSIEALPKCINDELWHLNFSISLTWYYIYFS